MIRPDDDGGFEICSVSLSRNEDRGPLQMISGERLAQLQDIEAAAVRIAVNPSPDNIGRLVALVRKKPPVEKT